MKKYLYSVYNKMGEFYGNLEVKDFPPTPEAGEEAYRRSYKQLYIEETKKATAIQFRVDFIGTYDDNTGLIDTSDKHILIDFMEEYEKEQKEKGIKCAQETN